MLMINTAGMVVLNAKIFNVSLILNVNKDSMLGVGVTGRICGYNAPAVDLKHETEFIFTTSEQSDLFTLPIRAGKHY